MSHGFEPGNILWIEKEIKKENAESGIYVYISRSVFPIYILQVCVHILWSFKETVLHKCYFFFF